MVDTKQLSPTDLLTIVQSLDPQAKLLAPHGDDDQIRHIELSNGIELKIHIFENNTQRILAFTKKKLALELIYCHTCLGFVTAEWRGVDLCCTMCDYIIATRQKIV